MESSSMNNQNTLDNQNTLSDDGGTDAIMDNQNTLSDNGGSDGIEIDGETETFTTSTNEPNKNKRKLRSHVWSIFKKLPLAEDKIERAECKLCNRVYKASSSNGTGTLSRHIKNCPRRNARDVGQLIIDGDKESMLLKSCKFDAEHFRSLVAIAIVMHDLPFQFVEYDGIRTCFEYLCPNIHCVSRNTVKADVLKMYEREKVRMKSMLESAPGRISLTSDCWSSITMDGYISLTAHYVHAHEFS